MLNFTKLLMKLIRTAFLVAAGWLGLQTASAGSPTQLIGFMNANQEWNNTNPVTASYGFYGFRADGDSGFRQVSPTGPDNTWANCATAYADHRFYCYDVQGIWMEYTLTYRVIDADTWDVVESNSFKYKSSQSNSVESNKAKNIPCGLAYDPVSDTLWAVTHAFSNTESVKLCKVDMESGELTVVADLPAIRTATCDAKGNIYGVGLDSNLYSISKDGKCTVIGTTGYWPTRDSEIKNGTAVNFRNGKMYWSIYGFASEQDRNYNRNGVFGLLEIDLGTAKSEMTFSYPSGQIFSGLAVPNAHPDAPDDIADLAFRPESASSSDGRLSFTVPSLTYGQAPLAGQVGISIVLDGNAQPERSAQAGSAFETTFSGLEPGTHNVAVTLSANGQKGSAAATSFYFGPDTPTAVSNLKLTYDKATDSAVLTWDTPQGANGGMLDTDNLRYKIERIPGNVIVARSAKGNSFTEKASFPWNSYSYRVTPYVGSFDVSGKGARSNAEKMGAPMALPFDENFDTSASLTPFTLIDANGDGNGTGWDSPEWLYDEQYGCALYYGKRDVVADDWLITPSLEMDPSSVYKLTFKYYAYYGFGSKFRVAIGSSPEVEAMDNQILYKETVSSFADRPGITETVYFSPRKGDTFIGFHHISETMEHLSIDDIHVERHCSAEIPAAVEDLTATKMSDTEVKLSFTLPTLNAGRNPLEGPLTVKIYKNDSTEPCATFTGKNPGDKMEWKDEKAAKALHIYRVATANAIGDGFAAEVSIDMRKGTPVAVQTVKASFINGNQVLLEWTPTTATTDEEGRPVDLENVRYLVYKPVPDEYGDTEYVVIGRDLKECRFIDGNPKWRLEDELQSLFYYVAPVNADDEGYATPSNVIILGESRELPFEESWANQVSASGPWFRSGSHGATWYIRYKGYDPMVDAYDGSGVIDCETDRDMTFGVGGFLSPRLDLTNADAPELTFHMYQGPEYKEGVQLAIGMDWGDGRQHLIPGAVYNARSDEAGWKEIKVSLADYIGYNSISVAFFGYTFPENTIHVDKVSVKGAPRANEIALTAVNGPSECRTGTTAEFEVDVYNSGTSASGSFTVAMASGDNQLQQQTVEAMRAGERRKVKFSYTPDESLSGKTLDLGFAIKDCEGSDTNPANNTLAAKMEVKRANSFRISAISGDYDSNANAVVLKWNVPDEAEFHETFIDDVENYDAFAISGVGAWTMHDGDGSLNYLMSDGQGGTFEWDNCREKQAFIVFNTREFGKTMGFVPTSGEQYFAAWPAAGTANDDWLISPELPGDAQLISFYARSLGENNGKDAIQLYVSESGTSTESFTSISGALSVKIGPEWTLYHFAIPEGSRHFAIRYVGNDGTGIMVDDIMYFGNPVSAPDGYNVYRDGVKINDAPVARRSFSDAGLEPNREYRYAVAPVYAGVEQRKSDEFVFKTAGIETAEAGHGITITGSEGEIVICGAEGKEISVYSVDGRLVASAVASGTERIAIAKGVYVASAGGKTVKVIVR